MGDRGHNRHGPKGGGVLCPFRGALGTRLIQRGLRGSLYFRTKWRLHPSSRLATIVYATRCVEISVRTTTLLSKCIQEQYAQMMRGIF